MRALLTVAAALAVLLAGSSLTDDDSPAPAARAPVAPAVPDAPVRDGADAPTTPPVPERDAARPPLLMPAPHGDGDSWRDTAGNEYRLGLVNAPEQGECFGAEATAERQERTAGGFRAAVYSSDRYGRGVSVVTTADGVNLNVHLARHGFVDDRYLEDFREQNPGLAAQLDAAFTAARAEARGLWGACSPAPQSAVAPAVAPAEAPAATAGCHPDYLTCLPVVGDGSGNGGGNDLDCGDVQDAAQARQPGVDPYRLDADGDGVGCDS